MSFELDHRALMEQAHRGTGLDDFGDVQFEEPLGVLVDALTREARLDDTRRAHAEATLVSCLSKRLHLVQDRKTHPSIADEVITAPIFIVGLPRTGSTHLHALLGQVEGVRTPLLWEIQLPSPPPDRETRYTDPRIAQVQAAVDQTPSELLVRHPVDPQRPEQCNGLSDWSFLDQTLLAPYEVPSYREWLFNADYSPAYVAHRRTLQHLQWRVPGRWVLKYPKHLLSLDALLAEYPDARLIWTHRDPARVLPSVASLTGLMRSATPGYDPRRFGPEWVLLEELCLRRGLDVRDRVAGALGRDIDVHYQDLMRDPVGTVNAICSRAGILFAETSRRNVERWVDEHPKTRHGVHRYRAEDFGLDRAALRRRFAFYIERFGVELEASDGAAR